MEVKLCPRHFRMVMNFESQDKSQLLFFPVDVTKEEIKKEGKTRVSVNDVDLVLLYHAGQFFAIQDKCPHNGGPFVEGDIEDLGDGQCCIRCPWHGWKFDLINGRCIFPRGRTDKIATTYPIKVEGQRISIGFKEISPKVFNDVPP